MQTSQNYLHNTIIYKVLIFNYFSKHSNPKNQKLNLRFSNLRFNEIEEKKKEIGNLLGSLLAGDA